MEGTTDANYSVVHNTRREKEEVWMSCKGEALDLTDLATPEQKELKAQMFSLLQQQLGQNASPLPEGMPIAAGMNPMSLFGADKLAQMMGKGGYQQPQGQTYNYGGYPGLNVPPGGGGGGQPGVGTLPPGSQRGTYQPGATFDPRQADPGGIWNDPYAPIRARGPHQPVWDGTGRPGGVRN